MAAVSGALLLPTLLALIFLTNGVVSDHSPAHSPSWPPQPSADEFPPTAVPVPAPGPASSSPPAPPPSDPAPVSPPPSDVPSPTPANVGDVNHENQPNASALKSEPDSSGGGMSGGQKAGVAIGVIAGVCIVGVGVFVYKKRRQNIQRAQYGYAARRELL